MAVMNEHLFPHDGRSRSRDLVQAAILHHLLTRHPTGVTPADLAASLLGRPATPAETRAVDAAVASLAAHDLVARVGDRVAASRAARRFDRLMTGGAGAGGPRRARER